MGLSAIPENDVRMSTMWRPHVPSKGLRGSCCTNITIMHVRKRTCLLFFVPLTGTGMTFSQEIMDSPPRLPSRDLRTFA